MELKWKEMPKKEEEKLRLQAYIERIADIKYQCYYLKLSETEFWGKVLWGKVK